MRLALTVEVMQVGATDEILYYMSEISHVTRVFPCF